MNRKSGMVDKPAVTITITLIGHVPGKKNLLRRSRRGGLYRDARVKADIESLVTEAWAAWGRKKPLLHPSMHVTFYVRDRSPDRDNKLTTILDVLQQAGVIVNDNIAKFNGAVLIEPAVIDKVEKTVLVIFPLTAPDSLR